MDLKRKRDDQAGRNTENEGLEGKEKGIEGKRWGEQVLILSEEKRHGERIWSI
jgi:hypothetical protein